MVADAFFDWVAEIMVVDCGAGEGVVAAVAGAEEEMGVVHFSEMCLE